jgi:hypothetical protein
MGVRRQRMTKNPKKIRHRLRVGLCNLEATGFKQMGKRQQRKITMFCLQLAQEENGNAPRMAKNDNRQLSPSLVHSLGVVSSIESMAEAS